MQIIPHFSGRSEQQGRGASDAGSAGAEGRAPAVVGSLGAVAYQTPPSTNRGVSSTSALSALVDYNSFTFPVPVPLPDVLALLEPCDGEGEWVPCRGGNGYKQGFQRGEIKVLFDGVTRTQDGEPVLMGIHVSMKGKGCRQFEEEQRFEDEADWRKFYARLLALGVSFTRIDFALDDRDELIPALTMERVRSAISGRSIVSLFKKPARVEDSIDFREGVNRGEVVHFGSIFSEVSVCFYDKAKEQLLPDACHWVRCELRARDDRAQALVAAFVEEGTAAVASVLYRYLDFKKQGADSNKSRWLTASWWAAFLEGIGKAHVVVQGVKKTLKQVKDWLEKQVAPSLALVVMADGGALDYLASLVVGAKHRVLSSQRHCSMLAAERMAAFAGGRLAL